RGDLLRRLVRLLVGRRAAPGDYLDAGQSRQLATDLVGDAICEVVVPRRPKVFERQNGHALDALALAPTPVRLAQKKHSNDRESDDGGNGGENLFFSCGDPYGGGTAP